MTITNKSILSTTVQWDDDTMQEMVINVHDISAIKPHNENHQTVIYGKGIDGWIINESFFIFRTMWSNLVSHE